MARAKTPRRRGPAGQRRRTASPPDSAVRALDRAVVALEEIGARFALIGGQAVAARTEPRFTEDVDFAVETSGDEEAQRLVYALQQRGWRVRASLEQTATGRLATVRLSPPGEPEDVLVDLLFATCGVEGDVVAGAQRLDIGRATRLPVASVGHLIALKVLSESKHRLQDRIDLQKLLATATEAELLVAKRTAARIERRGFARGKDCTKVLARLRKQAGR